MATTLANFIFLRPPPGGRTWLWRSVWPEPLLLADGGPSVGAVLGSDGLQTSRHVVVTSERPVTPPPHPFLSLTLPNNGDQNWWKLCRETNPLRTRPAAIFLPQILIFEGLPNWCWTELEWPVSVSGLLFWELTWNCRNSCQKNLRQEPKPSDQHFLFLPVFISASFTMMDTSRPLQVLHHDVFSKSAADWLLWTLTWISLMP